MIARCVKRNNDEGKLTMPTYYFVSSNPYTFAAGKDIHQILNEALGVTDHSQLPDDYLVTLYASFKDALAAYEANDFTAMSDQSYLIIKVRGPQVKLSEKQKANFQPGDGLEVAACTFRIVSVFRGKKHLAHLESPYSFANIAESTLTLFNRARDFIKQNPLSFSVVAILVSLCALYMGKSLFVGTASLLLLPLLVCLCIGVMGYFASKMVFDNIKNKVSKSKASAKTRPD